MSLYKATVLSRFHNQEISEDWAGSCHINPELWSRNDRSCTVITLNLTSFQIICQQHKCHKSKGLDRS